MLFASNIQFSVLAQQSNIPSNVNAQPTNQIVEKIISQIHSCPSWSDIERGGIMKVESRLMDSLAKVSENDIAMIREAIRILFSNPQQDTAMWAKVFILNRYLFQVPEESPIDDKLFGGWAGVQVNNGKVNRLWPLSHEVEGRLRIVGEFEGYFGNGYQGLDEFDYFQRTFGLRKNGR
jgi:hypothetical protein